MDKLRNFKHRLSLSVDKLSPSRRSKSPQSNRKSMPLGTPLSVGDIPTLVEASSSSQGVQRVEESKPKSRSSSLTGEHVLSVTTHKDSDICDIISAVTSSSPIPLIDSNVDTPPNELSTNGTSPLHFKSSPKPDASDSLMSEVLKEVSKLTDLTNEFKTFDEKVHTNGKGFKNLGLNSGAISKKESVSVNELSADKSAALENKRFNRLCEKSPTSDYLTLSTVSNLQFDSATSGYYTDTTSEVTLSESKESFGSYERKDGLNISTQQLMSSSKELNTTSSPTSPEPSEKQQPKKESIYSRLKRTAKRGKSPSVSTKDSKEPLYAKVKPKLKMDISFKPIEPDAPEISGSPLTVVKPEPVYSKVKSKGSLPSSPISCVDKDPLFSVSNSDNKSSFKKTHTISPYSPLITSERPIFVDPEKKDDSKRKSCAGTSEPIYSKVKKRLSSTFPRGSDSGSKTPIYTQPLPALPPAESGYGTLGRSSDYEKVTVRAKEISSPSPSTPSIITISNPGYSMKPITPTTSPLPLSGTILNPSTIQPRGLTPSPISAKEEEELLKPSDPLKDRLSMISPSSTEQISLDGLASETSLLHATDSDTESTGKGKLSRLVEELAQELESVTQSLSSKSAESSKKDVLCRLLETYDVPKSLKRVEEADYAEIKKSEKSLIGNISIDELRYVDESDDKFETVYSDVPDYSQDEFVIALDDENDPKYASLTRNMRDFQRSIESPSRVSRKSAQVYVNVVNVISALKVLVNSNSSRAQTVITKMGTIARPYASKVSTSITDTSWIQRKIYHKSGHHGFDELRRYIKSGGEFCKELAAIMHERAELETAYAKGLNKLSAKLNKSSKEQLGTINVAWQAVANELEQEGEAHKLLAASLTDDVVKPLRQLIDTQHKIRKGVESMVDKTTKNLHEWRSGEAKAKKTCYANCRENEKIQDMMLESRLGRGRTLSEKEAIKMEKQRRKAEEAVQKSDLDYYSCCVRSERARLEWESAIYKGSNCFQTLEEERLTSLKDLILKYQSTINIAAPKLMDCAKKLEEPVNSCDIEKDIQTIINAKGTGENIPEQMLPDFYAEDMNNVMNKDRRRDALEKFVKLLRGDLDRERRGKQGVENLAKALQETPNFGGEDSQQDVNDKLLHMKAMLAYLEAARYKVQTSLDEINNRPKMSHPLAKHIEVHRDKQGVPITILKVPPWVRGNSVDVSPASESPAGSPNWNDRGTADGNSVQPDSDFADPLKSKTSSLGSNAPLKAKRNRKKVPLKAFMCRTRYPSLVLSTDEFSSQGSDRDYQNNMANDEPDKSTSNKFLSSSTPVIQGNVRCKALYDYDANMYDELTIRTGDLITLHEKQPDGWWIGELDGVIGIFPATYVEEID